jgi:tetratricopeptide (TPR) repeat protein
MSLTEIEAHSYLLLGGVALAREQYTKAQELMEKSISGYRSTGRTTVAEALALSGCASRALGQYGAARAQFAEALQTGVAAPHFFALMVALSGTALLLAKQGQLERAVEVYATAAGHPYVGNSRWFEDIVGRHIAALAATLPPDVVAAAQERGRAQDLWDTAAQLAQELKNTNQD